MIENKKGMITCKDCIHWERFTSSKDIRLFGYPVGECSHPKEERGASKEDFGCTLGVGHD